MSGKHPQSAEDALESPAFLRGGGQMGNLIRSHDWSGTPFGPPDSWPQLLRSALSVCLHSSFPTAIYWGPELRLLYNDAWAPIPAERHPWALGRRGAEVWADIWDVVGPQFDQVIRTGEGFSTFDQLLRMVRKGVPHETYWNYSFTPLIDEDGTVLGVFNQGHETTAIHQAQEELRELNESLERRVTERTVELQQAQEALRQSQKLEAMGQLTGGVAHDFNNLLTPIIGSLDMLQRRGVGDERTRRLIDGALQSADRAKTLVQRLLAFARRQPLQPVAVDIAALVTGMAELIESTSGPRVKVEVAVSDGIPPAKADANQVEMALLNLAVNARDAMPDGGTLSITASGEQAGPGHKANLPAGNYVRLAVSDTGIGMDAATLDRAIEPFFSTKGVGQGTGLGLSMVHGLASQLGGALTISSRPKVGTCVELWLPVARDQALEPDESEEVKAPAGSGDALLVDDEELVRASTADMLSDLGFKVTEARSAEEALLLLKGGFCPDLLVTDHLMAGKSGSDLVQEARILCPGLRTLIVSGYADHGDMTPDVARLVKPFRHKDLAESVSAVMG